MIYPSVLYSGNVTCPAYEYFHICQKGPTRNVLEMSCVLAQEICLKFCPILYLEMSKFPGVGNVYPMKTKCELSCTFHGISLPPYRISSSDSYKSYTVIYNYSYIGYLSQLVS